MAASTHVLTDLTTLANGAPTAASLLKARSASGGNQDLKGHASLCLLKAQELKTLLNLLVNASDAADPNLATATSLLGALI